MKVGMFVLGLLVAMALVVCGAILIWRGVMALPDEATAAWALSATALLPIVAWAGWWFGHTEARGRLAGIDQAVDKVMGAATKAAGLGVYTRRAMRQTVTQEPYAVVLPEVEIVQRQLTDGRHDVVEL